MKPEPENVAELLALSKDLSELVVDLAYAAVFFDDDDLAAEVDRLAERMNGYLRKLRQACILATRSPEDAELMARVVSITEAIQWIVDAASDIARVVQARLGIPLALRTDLRHADEVVGRIRVRDVAPAVGRSFRELLLPSETGMWVLAVRRGSDWIFDPSASTVIEGGDVLLYQGPEEGVNAIREVAGAPALPEGPEGEAPALTELDRAVDILIEMKNSAEVAVGLAYSSLAFEEVSLATEVAALEARSDELQDELESLVLRAAAADPDRAPELRGLLRLAYAGEAIFDAARRISWTVEHHQDLPPEVQMALEEAEERVGEATIEVGSRAEAMAVQEIEQETGVSVLAVHRGQRWIYKPRPSFQFAAEDRMISIGPGEGIGELEGLSAAPA